MGGGGREKDTSLWPSYSSLAIAFMCLRRILIRFALLYIFFTPISS